MTIRTIPMRIDQMRGILVETGNAPLNQKLRLVRGDDIQFNIDVVSVDPTTQQATDFGFDDTTVFRLVAKKEKDYGGSEVILAEPTAFNVPGHRSDLNVAQGKLSVRFKLNRKALATALGTKDPSIKVVIDIEAITLAGEVSTLVQLNETVLNDAAKNPDQDDNSPVEYATLEQLRAELRRVTHPDGGFYRIEGGMLMVFDIVLQDYAPIGLSDGAFVVLEAP